MIWTNCAQRRSHVDFIKGRLVCQGRQILAQPGDYVLRVMKRTSVFALFSFVITLSSCFRSADLTPAMYNSASNRHHQLTDRTVGGSEDEWMALIKEFETVVAANPSGEWADDAQYAIGSCWIWLSKGSDPVRIRHAIHALEKLLENYPDTPLVADAHYWLGTCHFQLGDNNHAAIHFQKVINNFFSHSISELAQFDLARIYEKQNNLAVAISMYESVSERSSNSHLVTRTEERIRSLRLGLTSDTTESELEEISSLGRDMPSERRSLAPPTDEFLAMPVITAPPPKTDDENDRTEGQSVPQILLSDEVEIASLPSTDGQFETAAPTSERRTTSHRKMKGVIRYGT